MLITKQTVADEMAAYLRHEITRAQLVDWAENALMEGEFDESEMDVLRAAVGRLGVADVRAFGLSWDDCEGILRELGSLARVEITRAQPTGRCLAPDRSAVHAPQESLRPDIDLVTLSHSGVPNGQRPPCYWVIAPVESKPPERFDKVWEYDLANNIISIGWHELGDVSECDRQELSRAVAVTYPDKPNPTKSLYTNMIWAFYHEITPDDFILARRGRKTLAAVGKVRRPAFYSPGKNPHNDHPNFLEVSWLGQPRDKDFHRVVFPMYTVAEFTEEQFRKSVDAVSAQPLGPLRVDVAPPSAVEDPNDFVLEKYMEEFIVSNFDAIFKQTLRMYEDADGNDGQQYATEIGPIDILAVEPKSNSLVVIELKKGRPSDQVVGQVLRYMGWVKKNICKNGQSVKGLVICRDLDPKLSYALEMTENIDVRYYNVSFKLNKIP